MIMHLVSTHDDGNLDRWTPAFRSVTGKHGERCAGGRAQAGLLDFYEGVVQKKHEVRVIR